MANCVFLARCLESGHQSHQRNGLKRAFLSTPPCWPKRKCTANVPQRLLLGLCLETTTRMGVLGTAPARQPGFSECTPALCTEPPCPAFPAISSTRLLSFWTQLEILHPNSNQSVSLWDAPTRTTAAASLQEKEKSPLLPVPDVKASPPPFFSAEHPDAHPSLFSSLRTKLPASRRKRTISLVITARDKSFNSLYRCLSVCSGLFTTLSNFTEVILNISWACSSPWMERTAWVIRRLPQHLPGTKQSRLLAAGHSPPEQTSSPSFYSIFHHSHRDEPAVQGHCSL